MSTAESTINRSNGPEKSLDRPAPQFKNSPMGRIPAEWEVRTLSQILYVVRGFAFESSDYLDFGVLNFRVTNVGRLANDIGDVQYLPKEFFDRFPKQKLIGGEIVVVMVGATTGKLGRVPSDIYPALMNQNMWNLEPKNGVHQDYLWHLLPSAVSRHMQMSQGSARDFLKQSEFYQTLVAGPFADRNEQAKIGEILSTVDRAIEQTEALIAKQQCIKTGLMQDLLTRGIDEHCNLRSEQTHQFKDSPLGRIPVEWETIQIGNAASLQRGYDITESELYDGPYPVVSSSGIVGYHCEYTSNGPNVVVGRKGTIGKVHYLENDFWAHDTSLYVTNFHGNSEKYFYYLFTHLDLARYGTKSGSPSLNRNDIHPLWVGLPKPIEQDRISTILMACDHQANSFVSNMEKAKQLKTALMQDLLTGKVRVTPILNESKEVNT